MEKGHKEQRSPNNACKDCDLTTEDDDTIQVSVNPRRFTLPSPNEKRKTVEIENKNAYPIYFKAGTSNMGAFRPQPNSGKIPANGKITVIVQFFDSATPIRRHEEVLVVASIRPFDQFSSYSDGICPYCCESVQLSRNHQPRKFSHFQTTGHQRDHEDYCYFDERRFSQNNTEENNSHQTSKEQFVHKNKNSGMPKKENQSTDYSTKEVDAPEKQGLLQHYIDSISRQSVVSKEEMQPEDNSSREFDSRQTIPKKSMTYRGPFSRLPDTSDVKAQSSAPNDPVEPSSKSSREHLAAEDRQEYVAKTTCTGGLEEICLHAFIHRPTHGDCHCNNCAELSFLSSGDFQIKNLQRKSTVEPRKATEPSISRLESGELRTVAKEDETKSDLREIKDLEKALEEKKREAHILARIIKAKDVKDSSDTEISEMSIKDSKLSRKRPKFISEEDFKKKALKARAMKYQKHLEEESASTTTTDVTAAKEKEPSPEKKLRQTYSSKKDDQCALGSIDAKCTAILQLTWTTVFLLILLLIVLIAFVVFFCSRSGQNGGEGEYRSPCLFTLFK